MTAPAVATSAAYADSGREAPRRKPRRDPLASRALRWLLLLIAVVVALLPFLWMARTAFGPPQTIIDQTARPFPSSFTFDNFSGAWSAADLGTALTNGILVSLGILILQLLTAIPAAYAFACLRFPGRNLLFGLVLAGLLVPPQAVAVPNYVTISGFGLADTRLGLVVPFAASAFAIFLLRQYMSTVPVSMLEAARMDGLGPWRTLVKVVLPLSTPAVATVATFSFLVTFNEYLWPLLVARSPENYTPPLALAKFTYAAGIPDFAQLSAAALIVSLPTLIVFLLAQRKLAAGLTGSGIGA